MTQTKQGDAAVKALPRGVWMLGITSLFMDMSSEMAHAVLPLFLVGTLGASVAMVGLIDGLAEAVAQVLKLVSGVLSDRVGRRKWLAVAGYGLSALTKPLFPLAGSSLAVLVARLADRVGKGIRGSPRDAMVADMTPPALRGAAFGLRQALDTVGAILGPLIAVLLLWHWQVGLVTILWVACVPAVLAVAVLAFGVPEGQAPARDAAPAQSWRAALRLRNPGAGVWRVVAVGVALSAARMSEAFLVLKAQDAQWPAMFIPLVMVVMSVAYVLAVYPVGVLADAWGTRGLLLAGLATLAVADAVLATGQGTAALVAGVALWGLHMGLTQGLLGKMVADAAPANLRGSAFGFFNLASGVASLASAVVGGLLWDGYGPASTFIYGAGLALLAAGATVLAPAPRRPHAQP